MLPTMHLVDERRFGCSGSRSIVERIDHRPRLASPHIFTVHRFSSALCIGHPVLHAHPGSVRSRMGSCAPCDLRLDWRATPPGLFDSMPSQAQLRWSRRVLVAGRSSVPSRRRPPRLLPGRQLVAPLAALHPRLASGSKPRAPHHSMHHSARALSWRWRQLLAEARPSRARAPIRASRCARPPQSPCTWAASCSRPVAAAAAAWSRTCTRARTAIGRRWGSAAACSRGTR